MIRPEYFAFNEETAHTNKFQTPDNQSSKQHIQNEVLAEFDQMVASLREAGIVVNVFSDTPDPPTPDAVFPNNWIIFHRDESYSLFPMQAKSRRAERREDVIHALREKYRISRAIDYSAAEDEGRYLEGTGSMVIDHVHKKVYACRSPRTDEKLLQQYCADREMEPILFSAKDQDGVDIYHTNVMMCITHSLAIIALASITDVKEREMVKQSLKDDGLEIVDLSPAQLYHFSGNMLELNPPTGRQLLLMSQNARQSLSASQLSTIEESMKILAVPINTIEKLGGGSVRCMVAEIFSPQR